LAKRDYYEVLGVSRDADDAELKRAFRNQARRYHPDVNADPGAAERFKEINEAYSVLSDPEKRSRYDRFGQAEPGGIPPGGFDFGFGDLFDAFFGEGFFGARPPGRSEPERGRDLLLELEISLEEVAAGAEKEVQVPSFVRCATCGGSGAKPGTSRQRCTACGGSGQVQSVRATAFGRFVSLHPCAVCGGTGEIIPEPCAECHGQGRLRRQRTVQVRVPPGAVDGLRLRLAGQGEAGARGAAIGDLFIQLRVKPHPYLRRDGDDLVTERKISFTQAILGVELELTALGGKEKMVVPPGTQPGTVLRLKGKGLPHLRGHSRGDLVVRVSVELPTHLTAAERQLLTQLAELRGEQVHPKDKGIFQKVRDALGG
jgi:molecular chaperone DnaJ